MRRLDAIVSADPLQKKPAGKLVCTIDRSPIYCRRRTTGYCATTRYLGWLKELDNMRKCKFRNRYTRDKINEIVTMLKRGGFDEPTIIRQGSTPLTTRCATRWARVLRLPRPAPAITSSGGAVVAHLAWRRSCLNRPNIRWPSWPVRPSAI
jgi:hypothetical protein